MPLRSGRSTWDPAASWTSSASQELAPCSDVDEIGGKDAWTLILSFSISSDIAVENFAGVKNIPYVTVTTFEISWRMVVLFVENGRKTGQIEWVQIHGHVSQAHTIIFVYASIVYTTSVYVIVLCVWKPKIASIKISTRAHSSSCTWFRYLDLNLQRVD